MKQRTKPFLFVFKVLKKQKKRDELIAQAEALLTSFGIKTKPLQQAARFTATRKINLFARPFLLNKSTS